MTTVRLAALAALDAVPFNVGFARAVVDGVADGELWADSAADPRAFHAIHPCGMSLAWGPGLGDAAEDVVRRVRGRAADGDGEWLQVDSRWHHLDWDRLLGAVPLGRWTGEDGSTPQRPGDGVVVVRRTRVNFAFDAEAFAARGRRVPDAGTGHRVRRAAEDDFAWSGSTVPGRFWPDAAAFVAHGGGWVVEADGTPAAIAFCSFRNGDEVEIGIETVPALRRRGLAALVASAMIKDLLGSGLLPVWSCREDNAGSFRLAEALGFRPVLRLPYFQVLSAAPSA